MVTLTKNASSSSKERATVAVQSPINLENWIEENREKFKPPVSNRYLYDGRDFFVMVIKGPNARNDFHKVDSEEYFYQLKGDIKVRIRERDRTLIVPISSTTSVKQCLISGTTTRDELAKSAVTKFRNRSRSSHSRNDQ